LPVQPQGPPRVAPERWGPWEPGGVGDLVALEHGPEYRGTVAGMSLQDSEKVVPGFSKVLARI
jgi:hypothetical protein